MRKKKERKRDLALFMEKAAIRPTNSCYCLHFKNLYLRLRKIKYLIRHRASEPAIAELKAAR